MLAWAIRTDSGSVASAMLTALLRSRLGFLASLDFWIRCDCAVTIPGWNCLNPSRERKRAVSPGPATKAV